MSKNRLIAFGCSNTYGEGLVDCWDYKLKMNGPKPSKYAWPQIIANSFNIECVNLSKPGASNKLIANRILETEYQKGDVVIILWTFFSRFCFFRNDGSEKRLMIQDITNHNFDYDRRKDTKLYYKKYYSDKDAILDSYSRINLAKFYLDSIGVVNFHYTCDHIGINNKDFSNVDRPVWTSVTLPDLRMKGPDLAIDNCHPGPIAHENFAKDIIKHARLKKIMKG